MEDLLKKLPLATTRTEKQILSAQIVAKMPVFIEELGKLEQKYYQGLKNCIISEGTKAAGEAMMKETELSREYSTKRRLYDTIKTALPVLNMYTKET